MFTKILIANRGEIACRIIKTAKRLGIRTVAVFSDADRHALHVACADEAVYVGASASKESYLAADKIIQAALKTGAQAIHPGYGFLSENAEFARLCHDNKLVFIGPSAAAIDAMGSKSTAKTIMQEAGVPLIPGYHGDDQNPALLRESADNMGYPVLLKAVAGGGGKGMRQVCQAAEFDSMLEQAKSEAMASVGDDKILVEKYLSEPRHVELQIFRDQFGNCVYLFERDCSVQRRHQKVIEEAPAPNMPKGLREKMGEAAMRAAHAIDYQGAGTVEFLLDQHYSFYFIEMNTRLQVEHPVTEMITGLDLVEWQLRVANREPLPLQQEQLSINGHAFEARIYAEDPGNDFLPTAGHLNQLRAPQESNHIRVDTGVAQGDEISPYYDPMIAKLIVWGDDRTRALSRLACALTQYQISGVTTNIQFLYNLATCPAFVNADINTGFIENNTSWLFEHGVIDLNESLVLIALYLVLSQQTRHEMSPWDSKHGWRLNQPNYHQKQIEIDGEIHSLSVQEFGTGIDRTFEITVGETSQGAIGVLNGSLISAEIDGHRRQATITPSNDIYTLFCEHGALNFACVKPDFGEDQKTNTASEFIAPMNGTIVDVLVTKDAKVNEGDPLIVIEAMKMQHTIRAPKAGTVKALFCTKGALVDGGSELLEFESD